MAIHSDMTKVISSIDLGTANGGVYEIHDAKAIHSVADLGLTGYLKFKGAVASESALPTTGNEVGDIYHAVKEEQEYIWVADDNPAVTGHWEEFGSKLMVSHVHSLPSLSGSIGSNGSAAAQKWTQNTGAISGTAAAQEWTQGDSSVTVEGSNKASVVTGTVNVSVTTPTYKYLSAALNEAPTLVNPTTDSVLGTGTTFTASGTTVGSTGTAKAITGFGTHTTASAITELNSTTVQEVKSIVPGEAASWSASVSDAGVLSFKFDTNKPTQVTKGASASLATPTAKNTAKAITALGTATTKDCLTGVQVTKQPTIAVGTNDQVAAMTGATISKPSVILTANATTGNGRIKYTEATTDTNEPRDLINGSAAAQEWTQGTSSVTVAGTNTTSTVSGSATVTGTNAASKVTGSVSITTTGKFTGVPQQQ